MASSDLPATSEVLLQTDAGKHILDAFLGQGRDTWGASLGGSQASELMLELFSAFNLVALAVVSALFIWILAVAVAGTAHEGTPFGKRYSSLWMPLRFVGAMGALAPIFKGLSFFQVAILACIGFSINLGNYVWAGGTVMKRIAGFLLLLSCVVLSGCAGKKGEVVNPVPVSPEVANAPKPAEGATKEGAFTPHDASYQENASGQSLVVHVPADPASGPRKGEPAELKELLDMKGSGGREQSAVQLMRPKAIREAARLVTFQTAMSWRYGQLLAETERYSAIMDTAFNFAPLLLTQGEALILPPQIARAGASMRIKDGATATAAKTTYELLEPARYIAVVPNWREFLMADDFPAPEQPNPAVLPKNAKERAIWRAAVREAWEQGLAEADQLYADNVSRMARSYRGAMLYHLLTAQHLMSRVNTASADLGTRTQGNKLNIGQKVYRITAPSAFTVSPARQKKRKR